MRSVLVRLRVWLRRGRFERELDEELAFHVEMKRRELLDAGAAPEAAAHGARRAVGSALRLRERARDVWVVRPLDTFLQDLRLGARMLRRDPAFSAMAIVTLALGIGANSAIFSVVRGAILRPLDFAHAERVVRVWQSAPARNLPQFSVTPADYFAWKSAATTFDAVAAYERQRAVVLTGDGSPEEALGARVSADLFPLLGTEPDLGRGFLADEDRPAARPVVILGHGFWQRRFGGTPGVLGRSLTIDGEPHAIVGVMPRGFVIPNNPAELWTPMQIGPAQAEALRGNHYLRVLARLGPGSTLDRGRAELERLAANDAERFPDSNRGWSVTVLPLLDTVVGETFRHALLVLTGVVGVVLLMACANVASLLLARSMARRQELAIRAALGAGRTRLVSQLLTESALLAGLASLLALVVAAWSLHTLRVMEPSNIPRLDEIRIDRGVLIFTLLVAMLSALLFGAAPAWRASRWALLPVLKSPTTGAAGQARSSGGRDALRHGLVVAEVGLALTVLVGAALMVQSLLSLRRLDLGFRDEGVLMLTVNLRAATYPPPAPPAFADRFLEETSRLPGVIAAGAVSSAPFAGPNSAQTFRLEETPLVPNTQSPDADIRVVAGDYFRALRVPLRRGRTFDTRDRADSLPVAIISETMAQRHWPKQDPIGRRLRVGDVARGPLLTVIGIVGDAQYGQLDERVTRPMIYRPQAQTPSRAMTFVVHASTEPAALAEPLRRVIATLDPDLPVSRLSTFTEVLGRTRAQSRLETSLFVALAVLAFVLAVVGLYGLMAWSVLERRRELGVRLALGATGRDLLGLVLRRGLGLAAAGIVIGVGLSLALGRLLTTMLVGVHASDPWTLAATSAALLVVAALACVVPARRVLGLDPVRALRAE